jgi:hypothetical protein
MEEGAVGGVSDIMTGKTEAGQRTADLTHATLFLNILHNWQLYIV